MQEVLPLVALRLSSGCRASRFHLIGTPRLAHRGAMQMVRDTAWRGLRYYHALGGEMFTPGQTEKSGNCRSSYYFFFRDFFVSCA